MQREVVRWVQSLDLGDPLRHPRHDLKNGVAVGQILSRHVVQKQPCTAAGHRAAHHEAAAHPTEGNSNLRKPHDRPWRNAATEHGAHLREVLVSPICFGDGISQDTLESNWGMLRPALVTLWRVSNKRLRSTLPSIDPKLGRNSSITQPPAAEVHGVIAGAKAVTQPPSGTVREELSYLDLLIFGTTHGLPGAADALLEELFERLTGRQLPSKKVFRDAPSALSHTISTVDDPKATLYDLSAPSYILPTASAQLRVNSSPDVVLIPGRGRVAFDATVKSWQNEDIVECHNQGIRVAVQCSAESEGLGSRSVVFPKRDAAYRVPTVVGAPRLPPKIHSVARLGSRSSQRECGDAALLGGTTTIDVSQLDGSGVLYNTHRGLLTSLSQVIKKQLLALQHLDVFCRIAGFEVPLELYGGFHFSGSGSSCHAHSGCEAARGSSCLEGSSTDSDEGHDDNDYANAFVCLGHLLPLPVCRSVWEAVRRDSVSIAAVLATQGNAGSGSFVASLSSEDSGEYGDLLRWLRPLFSQEASSSTDLFHVSRITDAEVLAGNLGGQQGGSTMKAPLNGINPEGCNPCRTSVIVHNSQWYPSISEDRASLPLVSPRATSEAHGLLERRQTVADVLRLSLVPDVALQSASPEAASYHKSGMQSLSLGTATPPLSEIKEFERSVQGAGEVAKNDSAVLVDRLRAKRVVGDTYALHVAMGYLFLCDVGKGLVSGVLKGAEPALTEVVRECLPEEPTQRLSPSCLQQKVMDLVETHLIPYVCDEALPYGTPAVIEGVARVLLAHAPSHQSDPAVAPGVALKWLQVDIPRCLGLIEATEDDSSSSVAASGETEIEDEGERQGGHPPGVNDALRFVASVKSTTELLKKQIGADQKSRAYHLLCYHMLKGIDWGLPVAGSATGPHVASPADQDDATALVLAPEGFAAALLAKLTQDNSPKDGKRPKALAPQWLSDEAGRPLNVAATAVLKETLSTSILHMLLWKTGTRWCGEVLERLLVDVEAIRKLGEEWMATPPEAATRGGGEPGRSSSCGPRLMPGTPAAPLPKVPGLGFGLRHWETRLSVLRVLLVWAKSLVTHMKRGRPLTEPGEAPSATPGTLRSSSKAVLTATGPLGSGQAEVKEQLATASNSLTGLLQKIESGLLSVLSSFFPGPGNERVDSPVRLSAQSSQLSLPAQYALQLISQHLMPEDLPQLSWVWLRLLVSQSERELRHLLVPYSESAVIDPGSAPSAEKDGATIREASEEGQSAERGVMQRRADVLHAPAPRTRGHLIVHDSQLLRRLVEHATASRRDKSMSRLTRESNDSDNARSSAALEESLTTRSAEWSAPPPPIVRTLYGRVNSVYVIVPLNQVWDCAAVARCVLRNLRQLSTTEALLLISAVLLSPEQSESALGDDASQLRTPDTVRNRVPSPLASRAAAKSGRGRANPAQHSGAKKGAPPEKRTAGKPSLWLSVAMSMGNELLESCATADGHPSVPGSGWRFCRTKVGESDAERRDMAHVVAQCLFQRCQPSPSDAAGAPSRSLTREKGGIGSCKSPARVPKPQRSLLNLPHIQPSSSSTSRVASQDVALQWLREVAC